MHVHSHEWEQFGIAVSKLISSELISNTGSFCLLIPQYCTKVELQFFPVVLLKFFITGSFASFNVLRAQKCILSLITLCSA